MTTLKQAISDGKIEKFLTEREPLEAPQEAVQRYIDASAIPLESSKEGHQELIQGYSDDCK